MKHKHLAKKFHFKDMTQQEMASWLDDNYPVLLKNHEDLVDRIHIKYPFATKAEISLIVLTTFRCIRELLVLGKVLSVDLFLDLKLCFTQTQHHISGLVPRLRTRVGTTKELRNT